MSFYLTALFCILAVIEATELHDQFFLPERYVCWQALEDSLSLSAVLEGADKYSTASCLTSAYFAALTSLRQISNESILKHGFRDR